MMMNYVGTTGISKLELGPEVALNTPNAGGTDTVIGADTRKYVFFTVPSTYDMWKITAAEVLNGTVLNGNWVCGVEYVDANPPVLAEVVLAAMSTSLAQANQSAVQKNSRMSSDVVRAGQVMGAFIYTASATGRYQTAVITSQNNTKSVTFVANVAQGNTTAWSGTTVEPYIKIYGRPVIGL